MLGQKHARSGLRASGGYLHPPLLPLWVEVVTVRCILCLSLPVVDFLLVDFLLQLFLTSGSEELQELYVRE